MTDILINKKQLDLQVLEHEALKGIPSASGIAIINDQIYVIGDNSPWLYELNQTYGIASKLLINHYPLEGKTIIPKMEKPDYETLETIQTNNKEVLISFGSGSLSPQRDNCILIDVTTKEVQELSLVNFYNHIRRHKALKGLELNIESTAFYKGQLYLFNRETNHIFQYSYQAFIQYICQDKAYPEPIVYQVNLPKTDTHHTGFSGASTLVKSNKIIFTASVEDTSNPIDDGEIIGSYIGLIDFDQLEDGYTPSMVKIEKDHAALKLKVESVTVLEETDMNEATILLVTDNDSSDGDDSDILRAHLSWID